MMRNPLMKPYILVLIALLCHGFVHSADVATDNTTTPHQEHPTDVTGSTVVIRNAMSEVIIDTKWAEITNFILLDHHPLDLPAVLGGDESLDPKQPLSVLGPFDRQYAGHNSIIISQDGSWSLVSANDTQAVLSRSVNDLTYQLTYRIDEVRPTVHVNWVISNTGSEEKSVPAEITAINGIHQDLARNDAYFNGIYTFEDGGLNSLDFPELPSGVNRTFVNYEWTGTTEYIALRSRFFAGIWTPGQASMGPISAADETAAPETIEATTEKGNSGRSTANIAKTDDKGNLASRISVTAGGFPGGPEIAEQHQAFINIFIRDNSGHDFVVKPNEQLSLNWSTTVTSMKAKDLALLTEAEAELEFASRWYRFFRLISNILLWLLNTLNAGFESIGLGAIAYGLAIICTTAIVKGVLHRVTYKQQYSMMKMQQLAPELRRLQAQHKDDRQAMAMKQMELWKKHGVNPFGGCLPMLIQMPIFFALFQVFNHAADMRGHGFMWVTDLTLPDQTFPLGFNWPFIGTPASINLLPLVYLPVALFQSLSMKMNTPNSGDKQKDEMQESMQKMFRYMPLFFFLFIYFFASGLVLYITISSLWTLIEIRMIRKKLGMDKPKEETKPATTS